MGKGMERALAGKNHWFRCCRLVEAYNAQILGAWGKLLLCVHLHMGVAGKIILHITAMSK